MCFSCGQAGLLVNTDKDRQMLSSLICGNRQSFTMLASFLIKENLHDGYNVIDDEPAASCLQAACFLESPVDLVAASSPVCVFPHVQISG